MTVQDVTFSLVIRVAIEYGVDAGLVLAVGIFFHIHVGELLTGLILVPAGDAYRLLAVGHAESCGTQGIGHHEIDQEFP